MCLGEGARGRMGGSEIGKPFGESHFDALVWEVEGAEVGLGERDQDFALRATHDEQRGRASGAVNVFDGADGDWWVRRNIEQGAADEVGDVDLVVGERGAFAAGDGDDEAGEGFGCGDGVDAGKAEDDAPFVQPVMDEFGGARGQLFNPIHGAMRLRHGWGTWILGAFCGTTEVVP